MSDKFGGFAPPTSNFSLLPHALIDALPLFDTEAELKVVLYILRHTWGFQEFDTPKRITLDEFMHGRKRKDGTRFDKGIGMSKPAVLRGLDNAIEHGFIVAYMDDHDAARINKCYEVNTARGNETLPQVSRNVTPEQQNGNETIPRTEKDTSQETNSKEEERTFHDEIPLTPAQLKGMGMGALVTPENAKAKTGAAVTALRAHPYWQAFEKAWGDGGAPLIPHMTETYLAACETLARNNYALEDVEAVTRHKIAEKAKSGVVDYRISFVVEDIKGYLAARNASKPVPPAPGAPAEPRPAVMVKPMPKPGKVQP